MKDYKIINYIIEKTNIFLLSLFIFKLFLIFFYVISDYQLFMIETTKIILRISITNDVLIIFFSILSIIYRDNKKRDKKTRIYITIFSALNIIFALFTCLFAFFIIVIT